MHDSFGDTSFASRINFVSDLVISQVVQVSNYVVMRQRSCPVVMQTLRPQQMVELTTYHIGLM